MMVRQPEDGGDDGSLPTIACSEEFIGVGQCLRVALDLKVWSLKPGNLECLASLWLAFLITCCQCWSL